MLPFQQHILLSFGVFSATAFFASEPCHRCSTPLHGISEWRDTMFDTPATQGNNDDIPVKEICVFPFPFDEVQLQGETRQLRLYEDRFLQLFDDAFENHNGLAAMGFIMDNGLLQTIPLVEIEAYNRMEGSDLGIFLTVRVVGRAKMMDIVKSDPYIKATCKEIVDEISPHHEKRNMMLDEIEQHLVVISKLEHDLAMVNNNKEGASLAEFEDRFEDEDDEDDEDRPVDRRRRFHWAYKEALKSDTQGYTTLTSPVSDDGSRTEQELTAASWAVFNTDLVPDAEDLVFRIRALDCCSLDERLRLGQALMRRKKASLIAKIEECQVKPGLNQTDTTEDQ